MEKEDGKLYLPENLYNEMLKFFRRTSLPRIQKEREQQRIIEVENITLSDKKD